MSVGELDRNHAVDEVSSRLAARRSGWNAADIRGEVEQLIARRNVVTDAAIRDELAEDLTARAIAQCVPLTDRSDVPEHIRALTSRHVLAVEADLTTRLIARAETASTEATRFPGSQYEVYGALDSTQRDVVAALAGEGQLVVVEGAAGAGKTTTLAAARTALDQRDCQLLVVTPTLKAARVAARELGAERVFALDTVPERLALAERYGAEPLNVLLQDGKEDALARIDREFGDGLQLLTVGVHRRVQFQRVRPGRREP